MSPAKGNTYNKTRGDKDHPPREWERFESDGNEQDVQQQQKSNTKIGSKKSHNSSRRSSSSSVSNANGRGKSNRAAAESSRGQISPMASGRENDGLVPVSATAVPQRFACHRCSKCKYQSKGTYYCRVSMLHLFAPDWDAVDQTKRWEIPRGFLRWLRHEGPVDDCETNQDVVDFALERPLILEGHPWYKSPTWGPEMHELPMLADRRTNADDEDESTNNNHNNERKDDQQQLNGTFYSCLSSLAPSVHSHSVAPTPTDQKNDIKNNRGISHKRKSGCNLSSTGSKSKTALLGQAALTSNATKVIPLTANIAVDESGALDREPSSKTKASLPPLSSSAVIVTTPAGKHKTEKEKKSSKSASSSSSRAFSDREDEANSQHGHHHEQHQHQQRKSNSRGHVDGGKNDYIDLSDPAHVSRADPNPRIASTAVASRSPRRIGPPVGISRRPAASFHQGRHHRISGSISPQNVGWRQQQQQPYGSGSGVRGGHGSGGGEAWEQREDGGMGGRGRGREEKRDAVPWQDTAMVDVAMRDLRNSRRLLSRDAATVGNNRNTGNCTDGSSGVSVRDGSGISPRGGGDGIRGAGPSSFRIEGSTVTLVDSQGRDGCSDFPPQDGSYNAGRGRGMGNVASCSSEVESSVRDNFGGNEVGGRNGVVSDEGAWKKGGVTPPARPGMGGIAGKVGGSFGAEEWGWQRGVQQGYDERRDRHMHEGNPSKAERTVASGRGHWMEETPQTRQQGDPDPHRPHPRHQRQGLQQQHQQRHQDRRRGRQLVSTWEQCQQQQQQGSNKSLSPITVFQEGSSMTTSSAASSGSSRWAVALSPPQDSNTNVDSRISKTMKVKKKQSHKQKQNWKQQQEHDGGGHSESDGGSSEERVPVEVIQKLVVATETQKTQQFKEQEGGREALRLTAAEIRSKGPAFVFTKQQTAMMGERRRYQENQEMLRLKDREELSVQFLEQREEDADCKRKAVLRREQLAFWIKDRPALAKTLPPDKEMRSTAPLVPQDLYRNALQNMLNLDEPPQVAAAAARAEKLSSEALSTTLLGQRGYQKQQQHPSSFLLPPSQTRTEQKQHLREGPSLAKVLSRQRPSSSSTTATTATPSLSSSSLLPPSPSKIPLLSQVMNPITPALVAQREDTALSPATQWPPSPQEEKSCVSGGRGGEEREYEGQNQQTERKGNGKEKEQQRTQGRAVAAAQQGDRKQDLLGGFQKRDFADTFKSVREALKTRVHLWGKDVPMFVEQGGTIKSAINEIPVNKSIIKTTPASGEWKIWTKQSLDEWKGLVPLTIGQVPESPDDALVRQRRGEQEAGSQPLHGMGAVAGISPPRESKGGDEVTDGDHEPRSGEKSSEMKRHRLYTLDKAVVIKKIEGEAAAASALPSSGSRISALIKSSKANGEDGEGKAHKGDSRRKQKVRARLPAAGNANSNGEDEGAWNAVQYQRQVDSNLLRFATPSSSGANGFICKSEMKSNTSIEASRLISKSTRGMSRQELDAVLKRYVKVKNNSGKSEVGRQEYDAALKRALKRLKATLRKSDMAGKELDAALKRMAKRVSSNVEGGGKGGKKFDSDLKRALQLVLQPPTADSNSKKSIKSSSSQKKKYKKEDGQAKASLKEVGEGAGIINYKEHSLEGGAPSENASPHKDKEDWRPRFRINARNRLPPGWKVSRMEPDKSGYACRWYTYKKGSSNLRFKNLRDVEEFVNSYDPQALRHRKALLKVRVLRRPPTKVKAVEDKRTTETATAFVDGPNTGGSGATPGSMSEDSKKNKHIPTAEKPVKIKKSGKGSRGPYKKRKPKETALTESDSVVDGGGALSGSNTNTMKDDKEENIKVVKVECSERQVKKELEESGRSKSDKAKKRKKKKKNTREEKKPKRTAGKKSKSGKNVGIRSEATAAVAATTTTGGKGESSTRSEKHDELTLSFPGKVTLPTVSVLENDKTKNQNYQPPLDPGNETSKNNANKDALADVSESSGGLAISLQTRKVEKQSTNEQVQERVRKGDVGVTVVSSARSTEKGTDRKKQKKTVEKTTTGGVSINKQQLRQAALYTEEKPGGATKYDSSASDNGKAAAPILTGVERESEGYEKAKVARQGDTSPSGGDTITSSRCNPVGHRASCDAEGIQELLSSDESSVEPVARSKRRASYGGERQLENIKRAKKGEGSGDVRVRQDQDHEEEGEEDKEGHPAPRRRRSSKGAREEENQQKLEKREALSSRTTKKKTRASVGDSSREQERGHIALNVKRKRKASSLPSDTNAASSSQEIFMGIRSNKRRSSLGGIGKKYSPAASGTSSKGGGGSGGDNMPLRQSSRAASAAATAALTEVFS